MSVLHAQREVASPGRMSAAHVNEESGSAQVIQSDAPQKSASRQQSLFPALMEGRTLDRAAQPLPEAAPLWRIQKNLV